MPISHDVSNSQSKPHVRILRDVTMFCVGRFSNWILITSAVFADVSFAQSPRPNSKPKTSKTVPHSHEIYVGILGQIVNPGVYQIQQRWLSADSLIQRAGGLTDQATTSSMRVFREGRIVSPLQADSSLLSGDVLIVESKQRRAAVNGAFNPEPQAYRVQPTAATSSDSDGVHVAFLNLLETPVVVKLRPENAQIEQIVQMLGQPIELSPSVTVLNSERVSRVDSDPSLSHSRVSDGSILIFPQRGVDRTRFPPFPQPFASEIETDAIAEANADPRKQSIELPKVRQMAHPNEIISSAYSAQPGMTIAVAVSQPMTLVAPPPPLASRYESSSPANDFASRMATRPFCGSPQFWSSSHRENMALEETIAPAPRDDPNLRRERGSVVKHPNIVALPNDTDQPKSTDRNTESPFSAFQLLGLFGLISMLIPSAIITKKYFDGLGTDNKRTPPRRELSHRLKIGPASLVRVPLSAAFQVSAEDLGHQTQDRPQIQASLSNPAPLESLDSAISKTATDQNLELPNRKERSIHQDVALFPHSIHMHGSVAPGPIRRLDRSSPTPHGNAPHVATMANTGRATADESNSITSNSDPAEPANSAPNFGSPGTVNRITSAQAAPASGPTSRVSVKSRDDFQDTPLADALRQLHEQRPL